MKGLRLSDLSKMTKHEIQEDESNGIEDIELDLFLQALFRIQGYDFRHYARNSIKRRVEALLAAKSLTHISSLIPLLAHDSDYQADIISEMTVSYSTLFRDPFVYAKLQQTVFPYLASFPRLNIWIAGCADGEEAYSLAILLHEANLLERSQIYASDISEKALERATSGILSRQLDADTASRYRLSSGQDSLSNYFISAYGKQKLKKQYLSKIHFENHNLVQQPGLISAELILCRNVLIYFNKQLQHRVISTLLDSLVDKGFLVIGPKETIDVIDQKVALEQIDNNASIYQK